MNTNLTCNIAMTLKDVPLQMWEMTTGDGQTGNVIITRLFHNKPLSYLENLARCYTWQYSPEVIGETFSVIGVILFFIGLFYIFRRKSFWLLGLIFVAPLFVLLELPFSSHLLFISQLTTIGYGILRLWPKKFYLR